MKKASSVTDLLCGRKRRAQISTARRQEHASLPMTRLLVTVSLAAALVAAPGCGNGDGGPTAPTEPSGPTHTYSISGAVTEYRGGSLSGVRVNASSGYVYAITETDPQGRYRLSREFSGNVGLSLYKTGYTSAWKFNLSAPESTVDFVLHPSVEVSARGDTLAGTISGDEYVAGDDAWFGGFCSRVPCKVVTFRGYPAEIEVRLRLAGPARPEAVGDGSTRLALYVTRLVDEIDPSFIDPPLRYCCAHSPTESVVATFGVPYSGYIAIAYELEEGATPRPTDSELFELTVRPIR